MAFPKSQRDKAVTGHPTHIHDFDPARAPLACIVSSCQWGIQMLRVTGWHACSSWTIVTVPDSESVQFDSEASGFTSAAERLGRAWNTVTISCNNRFARKQSI
jgi:hypothetical protein